MKEEQIEKLRGVVRDCVSKHLYSSAIFFADKEELKEWDQCLSMLGDARVDEHGNVYDTKDCNVMYLDKDGEDREINISSAICFLRGRAYEALENRAQARQWYKAAIKADPLCYEALECLIENHMLACEEETSLLSSLQFGPEDGWLSSFYSCLIKKYDKESVIEAKFRELEKESCNGNSTSPSFMHTLKNDTDLLACKAEYYHQCGEYHKCFELTSMALSWFAVGCYYYCIKKYDQSRRYFSKATSLDGTFASAWIGYGNAYAAQEEGDQAMSAYRTAARLFPGCHLPTLYIGMEYMRTHSYKLAEQFFMQAKTICPSDPLVYNELGVVAYNMKEYNKAVLWFEKTLAHIPSLSQLWEPTVVNLAHAYRKLKMYHEATSCYERALTLSTRSLSTYAGLAYTYHLQDNFTAAITHYHKALWLKPDDQFCTEMLSLAIIDEGRSGIDPKMEFR
ncbi:hypothetical protein GH714_026063 [Hevea brasiliensis]|uniref:Uncharacterized protein n=1 Tax=Hevea brasiliensis TaxID=3981 RepID=A0A6A6MMC3_HEVBR|nr:hypothetical protein GH714_026063 [Hevea brasiliensis]